jgi:hypothetical protein
LVRRLLSRLLNGLTSGRALSSEIATNGLALVSTPFSGMHSSRLDMGRLALLSSVEDADHGAAGG